MVWQMAAKSWGNPLRRPSHSSVVVVGSAAAAAADGGGMGEEPLEEEEVKAGLRAEETPEGSVGKILVSSVLLEIQRCMRVRYS